jgi:hypothetical protein
MSDPLDRAVDARIDAYRPDLVPPFDSIQARKRTRDRRRGLAAAAATALAVAGIAFVPAALGGGGTAPAPVAGDPPTAEQLAFHIKATDAKTVLAGGKANGEAISRCAQLPGLSNTGALYSDPAQYTGLVAAGDDADALTDCVEAVPGWGVTLARVADAAAFRTYTVQPSVRTVGNPRADEERDACFALPGVDAVGQGESLPVIYKVEVAAASAKAFEECISQVVGLHVPELGPDRGGGSDGLVWTGVTICLQAGDRQQDCQFFGEQEAAQIDDALDTAIPTTGDEVYCAALTPTYTVQFDHPSARTVPAIVPLGCGPMQRGAQTFKLGDQPRRLVQQTHADAGTGASATAFSRRCVAPMGELPAAQPGYVGRSLADVQRDADEQAPVRVVGRDGRCLDRTEDYQPDRVDLIVVRDKIIWAD